MTLHYSLQNFTNGLSVNFSFIKLLDKFPQWFKYDDIIFDSINGAIPFQYWNGGASNNHGDMLMYNTIFNVCNTSIKPLRLNFSNSLITESDFDDALGNIILDMNQNGNTQIEISTLPLYSYIKDKYKYYKFIFSQNASILQPITSEIVDVVCQNDDFDLVEIPFNLVNNLEFLSTLNNKSKIEIPVNCMCPYCDKYMDCILKENVYSYEYSSNSIYDICPSTYKSCLNQYKIVSIDSILNKYITLGIYHFKIQPFPFMYTNEDYLHFLISYFIRDEFKYEAYKFCRGVM